MGRVADELREIHDRVDNARGRDLVRGLTLTLALLIAAVWLLSLVPIVLMASRVSRPIRELTAALTDFAGGNWNRSVAVARHDEVGRAGEAFNRMAMQLRRDRDRLVYLTQMSSWQLLARKTAHEVKNSLTPIRLTVEEMLARQPAADRAFMAHAAQIVVSEIETLERRVRAFSEFAAEPEARPEPLRVNALVNDRITLLEAGRPDTLYDRRLDADDPVVLATADLVKGTLTNLLENAAEAAGPGGTVRIVTRREAAGAAIEVHDSGPGLDDEAKRTLFEPTITFKKHGMGLGLLIARKNALLCGGDVTLITGDLGGAGFRVWLPAAREAGRS
jgi:nitrogen fixation/metabolism regulation signal transduction histidine kinase